MSIVEAYLRDLRDERDAWMQAKNDIIDMRKSATARGASKVSLCLGEAIKCAMEQEAHAREVLVAAEIAVRRARQT